MADPGVDPVALYAELGEYERHFNNLQHQYRGFAVTWLAGAGAAIGYVLKESQYAAYNHLFVAGIGVAASIGICLLWMLDSRLYHQLLLACLDQAEELETRWKGALGGTRAGFKKRLTHSASYYAAVFYATGFTVTLALAVGALAYRGVAATGGMTMQMAALLLGGFGVIQWMAWRSEHSGRCSKACHTSKALLGGAGGALVVGVAGRLVLGHFTATPVEIAVSWSVLTCCGAVGTFAVARWASPRHPERVRTEKVDPDAAASARGA